MSLKARLAQSFRHALSPLLNLVGRAEETDRVAQVLERRDSLQQLITLIETKSGKTSCRSNA